MKCRHCFFELKHKFLDLGFAPPSNAYLNADDLNKPEKYYPLKALVCHQCWLVQTEDYPTVGELFEPEYAYYSSISISWLEHAEYYSQKVIQEFELNEASYVIEIASNDGYLLKNFFKRGIPCLGIEPAITASRSAELLGITVLNEFFGESLAQKLVKEGRQADLIIGNNVYAHVPDINDFSWGLKALLKTNGVVTLEFPHLMQLIKFTQFDTIYHEHFSYLSLNIVNRIFKTVGLRIWNVEELSTHGGSLRIYGCHEESKQKTFPIVNVILEQELEYGLTTLDTYLKFQPRVNRLKNDFLEFLITQNKLGKVVLGYGAAAKGNTLINFAGLGLDLLPYIFDRSPSKIGKFLPGSHIPVIKEEKIKFLKPDFIVIFPWNLKDEITKQLHYIRAWGGKFVIALPKLDIF